VSWIERMLEDRLAQAAANGELAAPSLEGKPLADLHVERQQGWWAEQFVRRELSHDRRVAAELAAATARAGFWRCSDEPTVRLAVRTANAAIVRTNLNLVEPDRLALFDVDDIVDRWRALHG
jgi:hypothetical protein